MGVEVRAVGAAFGQDVDPEVFEHQLALAQIELQIFGEGRDVLVEGLHHVREDREAPGQVGERGVGGIARIAVLLAPVLTGFVILGDGVARRFQLARTDLRAECG